MRSGTETGDFFDAESHPTRTFSAIPTGDTDKDFEAPGTLTIRGVSKPISLSVMDL